MLFERLNDECKCLYSITVIVISLMLILLKGGKRIKYIKEIRRGVLLTGLSGAGKTQLYNQLIRLYTRRIEPTTQAEFCDYDGGARLAIIDIPGQDDLNMNYFNLFKRTIRAIIFVIDSAKLHEEIAEIAELLYIIMLDTEVRLKRLPILIVCNKQDISAMNHVAITASLERELTEVRERTVNRMSVYDDYLSRYYHYLGKRDEDFKFSHLDCRVDIVDCSALPFDNFFSYMDDVENWLNELDELTIEY